MKPPERPLAESIAHAQGRYGGFTFAGQFPEGVVVRDPLPHGVAFPNGARAAFLLTFDVEGTYGNGRGDMVREIANYARICDRLRTLGLAATFNVLGRMAEEHGARFLPAMRAAGAEIVPHGYIHELNQRHGGEKVYAGHYGPTENLAQIRDGLAALERTAGVRARGVRLPYGHFNEFTYAAYAACGLQWASNVGMDDFVVPGQGAGPAPFRMQLGDTVYPIVEIPLDSQTYDWAVFIADEQANAGFVQAVRRYCDRAGIAFERSPRGAVRVWEQRMADTLAAQAVFTFLCHPINLAVADPGWHDAVDEFLFPVFDRLAELQGARRAWVCTCTELATFYERYWASQRGAPAPRA